MEPHSHAALRECPAEVGAAGESPRASDNRAGALRLRESPASDSPRTSDDAEALPRPAHRPSTAPTAQQDSAQTWGREGHLTAAQEAHLASMRRKLPNAEDAELLRWLRARGFCVEKALALKAETEAWHATQRPAFNAAAPAAGVVAQLKRGASTGSLVARALRAGAGAPLRR